MGGLGGAGWLVYVCRASMTCVSAVTWMKTSSRVVCEMLTSRTMSVLASIASKKGMSAVVIVELTPYAMYARSPAIASRIVAAPAVTRPARPRQRAGPFQ